MVLFFASRRWQVLCGIFHQPWCPINNQQQAYRASDWEISLWPAVIYHRNRVFLKLSCNMFCKFIPLPLFLLINTISDYKLRWRWNIYFILVECRPQQNNVLGFSHQLRLTCIKRYQPLNEVAILIAPFWEQFFILDTSTLVMILTGICWPNMYLSASFLRETNFTITKVEKYDHPSSSFLIL